MKKQDLILIGGGGHCKSCIEVILSTKLYNIVGILDIKSRVGEKVLNFPIIGTDDDIYFFASKNVNFIITLGQLKTPDRRVEIYSKLKKIGAFLPSIIASSAYVSKTAKIGEGTIIMHQVLVNADVDIGANCIVNTKSLIEHDVKIGNHCHISTSAVINGGAKISKCCTIGSNATIRQYINVCVHTLVGAGALVVKNLSVSGTYIGVPAKLIL